MSWEGTCAAMPSGKKGVRTALVIIVVRTAHCQYTHVKEFRPCLTWSLRIVLIVLAGKE
jgi:hypothetical protein